MSRYKAEKAARQKLMYGSEHHSYEKEQMLHKSFLNSEKDDAYELISSSQLTDLLNLYSNILGPDRLRGTKNCMICTLTTITRLVIEYGVDAEFSFAISDYYINELEKMVSEEDLHVFMKEILMHYYDLAQQEKMRRYSLPVAKAIRYMNRNVYEACTIREVADHLKLNAHYMSTLFKREVGIPPTKYIRQKKMDEAKRMLTMADYSITEIADMLKFCDVAHFSKAFREYYGECPTFMRKSPSA
jgi:AraC-like DNA-binding protein